MFDAKMISYFIVYQYKLKHKSLISLARLQKYLYFMQRENLIVNDTILFNDSFYAWFYGPVIPEINDWYDNMEYKKAIDISEIDIELLEQLYNKIELLFGKYSEKTLCMLTHGEQSWQLAISKVGFEYKIAQLELSDIITDAKNAQYRRILSKKF